MNMKTIERKIGEVFELAGRKYKTEPSGERECKECAMLDICNATKWDLYLGSQIGYCAGTVRTDHVNVVFVEVE